MRKEAVHIDGSPNTWRRALALLLACLMVFTLLPVGAWAADVPTVDATHENIYANGAALIITGDGNGGTAIYVDANGNGELESGESASPIVSGDLSSYSIYGGFIDTNLTGNTKITMTSGTVENIYGGSHNYRLGDDAVVTVDGKTEITVTGGTVKSGIFAGGRETSTVTGGSSITLSHCTVGNTSYGVYGGGNGDRSTAQADVNGGVVVDITDCVVSKVAAGGRNHSYVPGEVSITLTDSTVNGSIYGRDTKDNDSTAITIQSSTVLGQVYGGSSASIAQYNKGTAAITVSGNTKIGNSTDKGLGICSTTQYPYVYNGVTSFTIGNSGLSDGALLYVVLPGDYVEGTAFATGAKETDAARVKLTGSTVGDRRVFFDSETETLYAKTPPKNYDLDTIDTGEVTAMESDANYTLSKVTGLQNLAELVNRDASKDATGYTVTMLDNVDCTGETMVPIGGREVTGTFQPLAFSGTFDGNGKSITGLTIDSSGEEDPDPVGLFGYMSNFTVKNLTVSGTVTGKNYVGGIIGAADFGTVENCVSNVDVTGSANVGGLMGTVQGVTISGCKYDGEVKCGGGSGLHNGFGGIAGSIAGGVVENCTSSGTVAGKDSVGGIVGYNAGSYANYALDSASSAPPAGTVQDCASSATVVGMANVGGIVGCTNSTTISGCEFTGEVKIDEANIDPSDDSAHENFGGIVGEITGGVVEDCTSSGTVTGEDYVGGIVGRNRDGYILFALDSASNAPSVGTVKNCSSNANVSGAYSVGGVVGENGGTVENCCSTGAVKYNSAGGNYDYYFGGIVGYNEYGAVQNCYSTGAVSGNECVGGVAGYSVEGDIGNCYATGDVTGVNAVGGIVGTNNYSGVQNCYATGAVSGTDSVGGIVGNSTAVTRSVSENRSILNCAALGLSVTATGTNVGRVCGTLDYGPLADNVARGDMLVNGAVVEAGDENVGGDKVHGETVTLDETSYSGVFSGWDPSIWTIPDDDPVTWGGALPTLNGITAVQNPVLPGDPPVYVAEIKSGDRTKKYTTLEKAIAAAAESGDTIVVTGEIVLEDAVEISKSVTLDLNGKAVSGATVNVTQNGNLTVTDTSTEKTGTIGSAAAGSATPLNCEQGGVLTVNGGKVLAGAAPAISANSSGKITIGESATVTSSAEGSFGAIYLQKAEGGEFPTLEIEAGAVVENTEENGYAVYFADATGVTAKTIHAYFTRADTATVGRVYPSVTPSTETIDGRYCIFANGTDLKLEAGADGKTRVFYRELGKAYAYLPYKVTEAGEAGNTTDGYDLSSYDIYGGSNNREVDGDTKITLDGGEVKYIYGGGYGSGGTVTGGTSVTVGGTVTDYVFGGGKKANVTKSTSVSVLSAGKVNKDVYCGGYSGEVGGDTTVTISGKAGIVYGGGDGGEVKGKTAVTVKSGGIADNLYGGGYGENAKVASTEVKVESGGTVNYSVRGGGSSNSMVIGDTSVMIGGTVNSASGGGKDGTVGGNTVVTIESGATVNYSVYGGGGNISSSCSAEVAGKATVTVSGTVGENVYGGGSGAKSKVGSTDVKVESTGKVGNRVYEGSKGSVYGGGQDGDTVLGDTSVTIGGQVNHVYGGGDESTVDGDTAVTIQSTGTVTGSVYGDRGTVTVAGAAKVGGEGKGIVIKGTGVANGVESFVIGSALSSGAAVYVVLPRNFAAGSTIATAANEDDADYISLTGEGVGYLVPTFDGGGQIKLIKADYPQPVRLTSVTTAADLQALLGENVLVTGDPGALTVTLTGNVSLSTYLKVESGKHKLELGGYTLTLPIIGSAKGCIEVTGGSLTIGGEAGGTVKAVSGTAPEGFGVLAVTGGAAALAGGKLTNEGAGENGWAVRATGIGSFVMTGGELLGDVTYGQAFYAEGADNAELSGGKISCADDLTAIQVGGDTVGGLLAEGCYYYQITAPGGIHTETKVTDTAGTSLSGSYTVDNRTVAQYTEDGGATWTDCDSLSEAVSAMEHAENAERNRVRLTENVKASITTAYDNFTIDLNGCTWTPANGNTPLTLSEGAVVAVTDAKGGGKVQGADASESADAEPAVSVETGAALTLTGEKAFTLQGGDGFESAYSFPGASAVKVNGSLTVSGTGVILLQGGGSGGTGADGVSGKDANVTVSNPNAHFRGGDGGADRRGGQGLTMEGGALDITAGSFSGGAGDAGAGSDGKDGGSGVSIKNDCAANIHGGVFAGGAGGATDSGTFGGAGGNGLALSGGTLDITGGSFTGGAGGANSTGTFGGSGGDGLALSGGTLGVTGGSFTGGAGGANSTGAYGGSGGDGLILSGGTLRITGGVFTGATGGNNAAGGNGLSLSGGAVDGALKGLTCTGGAGGTGGDRSGFGLSVYNVSVTVDGGEFTGKTAFCATEAGQPCAWVINGGSFIGSDYGLTTEGASRSALTVNGGTFVGGEYAVRTGLAASLSGGTFVGEGESAYAICADSGSAGALTAAGKAFFGADGKRVTPGPEDTTLGRNTTLRVMDAGSAPTPVYSISGTVRDQDGNAEADALVTLKQGADIVATTRTDGEGGYVFRGIPEGLYNVVAESDGLTMTILVALTGDADEKDITLPEAGKNSVVEVAEDAPALVAGGVETIAAAQEPEEGGSITVKLAVTVPEEPEDEEKFTSAAKGRKLEYLDISLMLIKTSQSGESESSDLGGRNTVVLELVRPYSFTGKRNVSVFRYHDGEPEAEELTELDGAPEGELTDGTFWADRENGLIHIYASRFSTYAVGHTPVSTGVSYTITATAGEGGTITPSGRVIVNQGGSRTFTIRPEAGYVVADVLVDGKSVGAVDSYNFEKVTKAHTIAASFKEETGKPAWNPFEDVREGDWFYENVKYVYEHDLMLGTSPTAFSPAMSTERGMIVTILWRMEGRPEAAGGSVFTDVDSGDYYAEAVAWANDNGIALGYGNGRFGPRDTVTREQLAALLWRYAQYKLVDVSADGALDQFTDAAEISGYALEAVRWAVERGILSGRGGGILDPRGRATRAETAAMFMRYLQD